MSERYTATEMKILQDKLAAEIGRIIADLAVREIAKAIAENMMKQTTMKPTTTDEMIAEMEAVERQLRPMRVKREPDKNRLVPIWEKGVKTRYFDAGPIGKKSCYWCVSETPNIAGYILLWYEVREPGQIITRSRYSASKNFYTMKALAEKRAAQTVDERYARARAKHDSETRKSRARQLKRINKKKGLTAELRAMVLRIERDPMSAMLPRHDYRDAIIPFIIEAADAHNLPQIMAYVGRMGANFEDCVIAAMGGGTELACAAARLAAERRSRAAGEWQPVAAPPEAQKGWGPMDYMQVWKE